VSAVHETWLPAPAGPLTGLRILEVGHFVAAPYASRLLADYGAEVIKIEPPGTGDPLRALSDPADGPSLWWSSLGRNKKSVTLDLRKRRGQEVFLRLAAMSDAVIENFRVGQLEKWNIGWDRMQAGSPKTSLIRISGFGQTGPYKDRVAFAPTSEAFGGLRYLTRDPGAPEDQPPIRTSLSLGDSIAGLFASIGTLAAVLGSRMSDSPGRCVDVAMYESVFALLESAVSEYGASGVIRQPAGSAVPNLAPSNTYKCADGTWACLTSTSDRLFTRMCEAMERPELAADPRFRSNIDRARNRDALDGIIGDWAGTRTYAQVEKRLLAAAVPVSRIFSIRDCVEDLHYQHRKTIIEVPEYDGRITLQPNIFPSFSGADAPVVRWPGPSLGQHNAEVFTGQLGLSQQELTALTQEGVI
jgi:crotonobetainyl-CoA:carnitine CoA-transferase CaiB-like acyl-CoA transferase